MNIRKWLISIVLIVVFGAATFVVHRIYLDRLDEYRESNFDEFSFQVHSVLESHKKFSEYLQSTLVDNEYVLSLIYEANDATEERQSELRQELYDYLIDDYNLISEYDFKQMHFHFSDNTSFLRMHEPDKYGDNLEQSRYSVWLTNETYRPSVGFEEGRIFNAYRYVYPLSYNNEHIGSIEISVSVSSVINGLTELYDDYDYGMIMSKDIINNKVFEDKLEYYQTSTISDAFSEDKTGKKEIVLSWGHHIFHACINAYQRYSKPFEFDGLSKPKLNMEKRELHFLPREDTLRSPHSTAF
jgi:hypothetical protein